MQSLHAAVDPDAFFDRVPHDEAWACHGWERFASSGERRGYVPSSVVQRQLQVAQAGVRELAMHGARIERGCGALA